MLEILEGQAKDFTFYLACIRVNSYLNNLLKEPIGSKSFSKIWVKNEALQISDDSYDYQKEVIK